MKLKMVALVIMGLFCVPAFAQVPQGQATAGLVVPTCGTAPTGYPGVGGIGIELHDVNGNLCSGVTVSASIATAGLATSANQTNGNQIVQVSVLPAASGPVVSTSADAVVLSYEPRGQGVSTVAMSGTTSTQVIAGLASNYIYVQHCSLANDSTTVSTRENFQDGSGGTSILQTANPAASVVTTGGGGAEVSFGGGVLYVPTLGNGLFVANVTTGSATTVSCQGFYSTKKYF